MTQKNTALPVRPMNEGQAPIGYPLVGPSSVSEDAQHMYRHGGNAQGHLDRDLFEPAKRFGHVTREERDAFQPTERMIAAVNELVEVGLARYNPKYRSLSITRVHEAYTFAQGRGSQLIEVSIFSEHRDDAELLAVLIGGDLEGRETRDGVATVTARARHENATDSEHDASSTALLVMRNISQPVFAGYGRTTFTGVLTEANLYPIGVDPLKTSDEDTDSGHVCTSCEEHHPFAPFLPPRVTALSGLHFVTVETLPMRTYLVATPPAYSASCGLSGQMRTVVC